MKRLTYAAELAILTACGTSSAPTVAPTAEIDPNAENAGMTALLNDSIEVVFADEPQPDWYPALHDMSVSNDGWGGSHNVEP